MSKKYTKIEEAAIRRLFQEGKSDAEIAKLMSRPVDGIREKRSKLGAVKFIKKPQKRGTPNRDYSQTKQQKKELEQIAMFNEAPAKKSTRKQKPVFFDGIKTKVEGTGSILILVNLKTKGIAIKGRGIGMVEVARALIECLEKII